MSPTGREKALDTLIMIRMSSKLREALEELAQRDRRALSDYCRIVLEDHSKAKKRK